ncbi:DUF2780 domain-containing protein [Indioceanicola profundi]|uniref:DUF2780 domain-containing protein n=1 Tax=Indioceanicola profundi TaxID=2220096 RepID=UPI0013C3F19B|nr:DUF2780 domain-containing protein [Indioceanicola profundi]
MSSFTRRHALKLAGAACILALVPLAPARAAASAGGLVDALTNQLGISRPQAEGGAGALFGLARQRMAPDQFSQVEQEVPGVNSLIQSAPGGGQADYGQQTGGGLGGLAGGALGALNGQNGAAGGLGALAPLAGTFSQLGIPPDMAARFLPVVMEYLNGSGAGSAAGMLQGALGG